MSNVKLLDGATLVSSRKVALSMIKAALLANDRAGVIRLEVEDDPAGGRTRRRVMVVPGPARVDWPRATLEARLVLNKRRPVADIVFDWLATESPDPWHRAVEQGMVMLAVRGRAVAQNPRFNMRRWYRATAGATSPATSAAARQAGTLLSDCERERPEVWSLLDAGITAAMKKRTVRQSALQVGEGEPPPDEPAADPWLDERASDRDRLVPETGVKVPPAWAYLLIATVIGGFTFILATTMSARPFAGIAAAILAMILGAFQLPSNRNLEERIGRRLQQIIRPGSTFVMPVMSTGQRVGAVVLGTAFFTMGALIIKGSVASAPMTLIVPAGGIAYVVLKHLRQSAKAAITAHVVSSVAPVTTAEMRARPPADGASASGAPDPAQARTNRDAVRLDVFNGETLPQPSSDSLARLDSVRQRAPAIRALFRKGIIVLSVGTTALAILTWLLAGRFVLRSQAYPPAFPVFTTVLCAASLLALTRRGAAFFRAGILNLFSAVMRLGMRATRADMDDGHASIRPAFLSIIGGMWVLVAVGTVANTNNVMLLPTGRLLAAAALAAIVAYLFWFTRARSALERRYPPAPPQHLLTLRVFGSPHLADFLDLTSGFQWIGTRLQLDGPGTTGHRARDLLNFVAGRLDRSIVEDRAELDQAVAEFQEQPDRELRFPVNSMQCNNAIWKEAVDRMIDRSDAVVVDLASLSARNRGVAYEVGRLLARLEMSRIVLLIDSTTDQEALRGVIGDAWAGIPADSPNHGLTAPALRVFDMGGPSERMPDEALAEWQQRLARSVDRQRLLGLVIDATLPRRTPGPAVIDAEAARWTRFPLPRPVRAVRNAALYVILAVQLLLVTCQGSPAPFGSGLPRIP